MRHGQNGRSCFLAASSPQLISPCPHAICLRQGIFAPAHPFNQHQEKTATTALQGQRACRTRVLCVGIVRPRHPCCRSGKRSHHEHARLLQYSSQLLRRASTQSREPNHRRPSTKLKPFWRRRARWDRSLLSPESRFHTRFPIRLTAQGTAPRNSSAWSCRPVGGSEVPIHLHTTSHPILRFEGGTTVSSTRPGNWTW